MIFIYSSYQNNHIINFLDNFYNIKNNNYKICYIEILDINKKYNNLPPISMIKSLTYDMFLLISHNEINIHNIYFYICSIIYVGRKIILIDGIKTTTNYIIKHISNKNIRIYTGICFGNRMIPIMNIYKCRIKLQKLYETKDNIEINNIYDFILCKNILTKIYKYNGIIHTIIPPIDDLMNKLKNYEFL